MNYEVGKWGSGEVGRWGSGEVGKWGIGELGNWGVGRWKKQQNEPRVSFGNAALSGLVEWTIWCETFRHEIGLKCLK
jgi:hypothetical protein